MTWPQQPLGELCSPKQWKALPKSRMTDSGYPVYGANGIIGFAPEFTHAHPTILVGCRGSIGAVHVTTGKAYATSNTMALDNVRTDQVEPRFLARFLSWRGFRDVTSGTSQPQLTRQHMLPLEVPVPPLDEQRRLAAILDHADALRAKRRDVLAHIDSLNQSIFHDMFGDPVANPMDNPVSLLDDLIEVGRPITYGILKPGPDIAGGVSYVRVADMKEGGIKLEGVRRTSPEISHQYRRSLLREGDLLMSIRGHVGRFAHIPAALEGANITQDSARLSIASPALSLYVREAMTAPGLQRWMQRRTKGVAVRGLNIGDLRKVPIPVPADELVYRFNERVVATQSVREWSLASLRHADALFASLQGRAFRGELSCPSR